MKKEQYYSKPNIIIYKILTNICVFMLSVSSLLFLYLFFYQSMIDAYKDFKKAHALPAPIYEAPTINLPKISESVEDFPLPTISPEENVQQVMTEKITIDPSIKDAERVFVAYELGDNILTSRLIVDFISEYPTSIYRHKVRLIGAKLMNERGDFEGALAYIQKILGETSLNNEDYSESVLLLGAISRERKQFDSYIQSFLEQAYFRAIEPTKSKLSFYLGYLLLHKGEFQSSLSYFNNVIGEDGVLGKADLYAAQTMKPERINELENFIKTYPSSKNYEYAKTSFIKDILLQGEILAIRGYLDSAERFYQKIITYFSNTADGDQARLKIADLYYQKQKYNEAFTILQEVLNNEDNFWDPDALFVLGKMAFELDKQEQSLGYFRILIEKYPKSPHIYKAREWQNLIIESLSN